MTDVFNPSRLALARGRRGLTKIRLAKMIGLERRSVTAFEAGEYPPSDDTLQRIASELRFPAEFFFGEDLEVPHPDAASFRSMSKMTAAQEAMALSSGAIALHVNRWIEQKFELPPSDLPDLSRENDPETAAVSLRAYWQLGEMPVINMVHLLEAKGVRVFSLAIDAVEVDAFSMWRGNTPFVFLNTLKSAEHSRFDAAHELGHLVMHRHGGPQGRDAEREADAFASAFLMPRRSVLAVAPRFATLTHLIELKKHWTVSVAALLYRLHALNIVSDWHYRTLAIELSKRGYRKKEPQGAQRESSQALSKIFASLRDDGITKSDLASDLNLLSEEIEQLVFGLLLTGVSSARGLSGANSARGKADLRLVK